MIIAKLTHAEWTVPEQRLCGDAELGYVNSADFLPGQTYLRYQATALIIAAAARSTITGAFIHSQLAVGESAASVNPPSAPKVRCTSSTTWRTFQGLMARSAMALPLATKVLATLDAERSRRHHAFESQADRTDVESRR